jgi:hypothetical protein
MRDVIRELCANEFALCVDALFETAVKVPDTAFLREIPIVGGVFISIDYPPCLKERVLAALAWHAP